MPPIPWDMLFWFAAGLVSLGSVAWGVTAFVRWIAETIAKTIVDAATTPIVTAVASLTKSVEGLTDQVKALWEKSDAGEVLHRDHAAKLAAMQERLDGLRPRPRPRKRKHS